MEKVRLNTIYVTYQGEVNKWGIGTPVIFLRLQGCPIRCYKKSLGVLCDSPEALERSEDSFEYVDNIIEALRGTKEKTGINKICLTGGDPLWQNKEDLHYLFDQLNLWGFEVSVETSGVISIHPFVEYHNISWVIDYKLKSAAVKAPFNKANFDVPFDSIIKFVIYDREDLNEAIRVMDSVNVREGVKFAFGLYWGTDKITYMEMVKHLQDINALSNNVLVNMQAHKMAEFYDLRSDLAATTPIRKKL